LDSVNPSIKVSCFADNELDFVKQYINKKATLETKTAFYETTAK
jgi:hypothetical protein